MKEFLKVKTPSEIEKIINQFKPVETEKIIINEALSRVLAEDITAQVDIPNFNRSTVDGFAVKAKDTYGASESLPAYLKVVGEIMMGEEAKIALGNAEAVKIPTGGMLPANANAAVMVEYTQVVDDETVEVNKTVTPWENVIQIGEDIKTGDRLLEKGALLRPQDIGAMAGIGIAEVEVFKKPQVALISTGDELVKPEIEPRLGQIRNINQYSLTTAVVQEGGIPHLLGIVEDDFDKIKSKVKEGLEIADVVIISGGSSVGTKDFTVDIINSLGQPGVLCHGVSIRPGKPTIFGKVNDKPIFGLPGHPASALVIFNIFVRPLIHIMGGRKRAINHWKERTVSAKLSRNIASAPGREDYIRVSLEEKDGQILAQPIFGKSGLITTMVKADGMIKIDLNSEGLEAGSDVKVILF